MSRFRAILALGALLALGAVLGFVLLGGPPPAEPASPLVRAQRLAAPPGDAGLDGGDRHQDPLAEPIGASVERAFVPEAREAATGAHFEGGARWQGRVVDERDGRPLPGAVVVLALADVTERAGTTDAEGGFDLTWPLEAAPFLRVECEGYAPLRRANAPFEASTTDTDLVLALRPLGALEGRVVGTRAADGAGLEVGIWEDKGLVRGREPLAVVPTDAEGAFAFAGVDEGVYGVALLGPCGVFDATAGHVVEAGATTTIELVRPEGIQLVGRMELGRNRDPVAGVRVVWRLATQGVGDRIARREEHVLETGPDGLFVIDGLPPGDVRLEAYLPWSGVLQRRVRLTAPMTEVRWRVDPPVEVHGRVLDAAGRPATGVRVVAESMMRFASLTSVEDVPATFETTDAQGRFRFSLMPAGTTALLARPEDSGGPFAFRTVPRGALGKEEIVLQLPGARTVTGIVDDPAGAPVADVELGVEARLGSTWIPLWPARRAVPADGGWSFEAPDDVRLRITARHVAYGATSAELPPGAVGPVDLTFEEVHAVLGAVVDEEGYAVPGAQVRIAVPKASPRWVACDDYGRFEATGLPDGRVLFAARAPGHRPREPLALQLPDDLGERIELVVRREAPRDPATVVGEVVYEANQGPVPGLRFDNLRGAVVRLDGSRFEITGLRPGRVDLVARAAGMETLRFGRLQLEPGAEHDVGRHEVRGTGRLRVKVTSGGKPLKDAVVRLRRLPVDQGGRPRGRRTFAALPGKRTGDYLTERLPRYRWRLEVRHPKHRTHTQEFGLKGRETTIRVKLRPKGNGNG